MKQIGQVWGTMLHCKGLIVTFLYGSNTHILLRFVIFILLLLTCVM
jgi:hypothetical protein